MSKHHELRETDDVQGTQCFGTTELDDCVLRLRIVQRSHREPCHVLKGDPADPVLAAAVYLGFRVWRIETQRGAQPHLGEEGGLQDGVAHPALPQAPLDRAFRGLEWKVCLDARKRNQDDVFHAGGRGGVDETQLSLAIDALDGVSLLPRDCRRRC